MSAGASSILEVQHRNLHRSERVIQTNEDHAGAMAGDTPCHRPLQSA
jgi:hypothetical protein